MKVSERNPLAFCKLLRCRYISHEILYHAKYIGTVTICRKQVDDASVRDIWLRYFHKKYRHAPLLSQNVPVQKYRNTKVPSYDRGMQNRLKRSRCCMHLPLYVQSGL